MSRYQAWFELQRSTIDNGTAVARVVLEGPDQTAFATWSIGHRDLEASVDGMLESLRESLPKGRHQCRLVAFDSSGAQLSALPVVVVGASEAATEAANGRLNQERANALFLQNAEKQLSTTMRVVENAGEIIQAQNDALALLKRDRERNSELLDERLQRSALAHSREVRLNAMLERLAPLIEIGISVLGSYAAEWFDNRDLAKKSDELKRNGPEEVGELSLTSGKATSEQSPGECTPLLVASAAGSQGASLGCSQGDIGSPADGNRGAVGKQDSRRGIKRASSRKSERRKVK